MGEVEVVDSGSLDSLTEGWEAYGARTRILMLGSRADRLTLRDHGRCVAIGESAVSVFHRPRAEREELAAAGLDHAITSFQFVDVAMADLGRWMQPLIGQGWSRGEVEITAAAGANFDAETWTCFHHPSIPLPDSIPLAESPASMDRKSFVTHPGPILDEATESKMEEMAASMLGSMSQSTVEESEPTPTPTPTPEPAPDTTPEVEGEPAEPIPMAEEEVPPVPEAEPESPLEAELRQVISLLVAGGQEVGDIMEHPQFIEVSERASAAGVDVWGMFVNLSDGA